MEPLNIGVDFGSVGLRVAYAAEGHAVASLEQGPVHGAGWLLCERSPSSRVGVTFPSLKSRLGAPFRLLGEEGGPTPYQTVTEALAGARRNVEKQACRPVAQVVLCVPARYHTSQRAALRDAALAAGFAAVHLINDSVGAAIAHAAGRPSPATVLVFGAGYEGFELGLVRVAKGHVRALAYEGGIGRAGAALDELVLDAWAETISASGLILDEGRWDVSRWMEVRTVAQAVKETLGTADHDHVVFPIDDTTRSGRTGGVWFRRQAFEEVVRQVFLAEVSLVQPLLQKAGMAPTDVDAVILVGGTTRIPALQASLAEAVGCVPVVAPLDLLAQGAALHAAGLGSKLGGVPFEAERVTEAEERTAPSADNVVLRATAAFTEGLAAGAAVPSDATLAADEVESMPRLLQPGALERHVARLVSAGEVERARAELGELIREAQVALDGLPAAQGHAQLSPISPAYRSQLALSNARSCLERREFARAVSESHYAWKIAPDDPKILDDMIDVHCEAAMVNAAPEQYKDAIRWLECAFGHDESNARTRSLLAERHYLQAQELHRRGHHQEALLAAERCLRWDPDYPEAAELQRVLTAG